MFFLSYMFFFRWSDLSERLFDRANSVTTNCLKKLDKHSLNVSYWLKNLTRTMCLSLININDNGSDLSLGLIIYMDGVSYLPISNRHRWLWFSLTCQSTLSGHILIDTQLAVPRSNPETVSVSIITQAEWCIHLFRICHYMWEELTVLVYHLNGVA